MFFREVTNMEMNTNKKAYRFKEQTFAFLFKQDLHNSGHKNAKLIKGLPQYKGQANTGWTVWIKARTIADEMQIDAKYKAIFDGYKMEKI